MRKTVFDMLSFIRMKWNIFQYNYSWPNWVFILDGWLTKSAVAVPFVGYLILFNDSATEHLTFKTLTSEGSGLFGLSPGARLKYIYLGLLSLGLANAIYYIRRPYALRIGLDEYEYVERALKYFTISHYIEIDDAIRYSGLEPYTQHGKYYDSDFEAFLFAASGLKNGPLADSAGQKFNWVEAKSKYEGLLRSMLIENFFRQKIQRRYSLSFCLFFALGGYLLLLIPSADLFIKVMAVIAKPFQSP